MYVLIDLRLLCAWHAKHPLASREDSMDGFMTTIGTNKIWGREKDIPKNSLQLTDFAIEMDQRFAIRYRPNETYKDMLQRIEALPSKNYIQIRGERYYVQEDD